MPKKKNEDEEILLSKHYSVIHYHTNVSRQLKSTTEMVYQPVTRIREEQETWDELNCFDREILPGIL